MTSSSQIETVIWDFNGTIVDDLSLAVRSVNAQLARRGLPTLSVDRYRDVFEFPVETYYRRIGLVDEPMADASAEFFRIYVLGVAACPLLDGVRSAIENHHWDLTWASAVDIKGLENRFVCAIDIDSLESDTDIDLLYVTLSRPRAGLWIATTPAVGSRMAELYRTHSAAAVEAFSKAGS